MFSSREHVRALMAGDVWATVGWSGDLLQLAERSGNVALAAPASGVPLWADLWTVPAGASGGSGACGPARSAALGHCFFFDYKCIQRSSMEKSWGGFWNPCRCSPPGSLCHAFMCAKCHGHQQVHATRNAGLP